MRRLIGVAVVMVALSACSGGPSKGDISDALEKHVRDNSWDDATIQDLKTGQCQKSTASPGYACSVEFRAIANEGRFNEEMGGTFAFDKIEGEWKVTQVLGL